MTVGSKKRRNSSTKYPQRIMHTSLRPGASPNEWKLNKNKCINGIYTMDPPRTGAESIIRQDAVSHSVSQPLVT